MRLKEGRFQPLSANWSGHTNRLFVDSKGRLWATSTDSGLGLIEDPQSPNPQLRRYTRAQGLSIDEVWCVTEDRLGRIYAGTTKGVDRLDPGTGQIVHYTTADGACPWRYSQRTARPQWRPLVRICPWGIKTQTKRGSCGAAITRQNYRTSSRRSSVPTLRIRRN